MLAMDLLLPILERKYMHGTFSELKFKTIEESLAKSKSFSSTELELRIVSVGVWILENNKYLNQIADLRNQNTQWYFYSDPVSLQSTHEYFEKSVLPDPSRIWFLILDSNSDLAGHFGYSNFQPLTGSVTLDSVVKARAAELRMADVLDDSFSSFLPEFNIRKIDLEVLCSNRKAIALYEKLGFRTEPESSFPRMGKQGVTMSLFLRHK
jgi:RimJ/RimL family protein N-acetyltransferase